MLLSSFPSQTLSSTEYPTLNMAAQVMSQPFMATQPELDTMDIDIDMDVEIGPLYADE